MEKVWYIYHRREFLGAVRATCAELVHALGPWLIVGVESGVVHVTRWEIRL
jgi:hypothetical protein